MPIDATAEQQAEMRQAYGFDRPLPIQYGIWLWKVLHGDLGNSIASGRPVLSEVSRAVGNSLILASVATLIGFTFGTFFGLATSAWFAAGGVVAAIANAINARRGRRAEDEGLPADMSTVSLVGGGLIAGDALAALGLGVVGLLATLAQ